MFELWLFFTDWSLGGRYALLETAIRKAEKSLSLDGIKEAAVMDGYKGTWVYTKESSTTARGKESQ